MVQVVVRENNVDQALKALKKKMQREGIFREMKMRRHYEKPSEKRAREKAEAIRRARKLARKRSSREEYTRSPATSEFGPPSLSRAGAGASASAPAPRYGYNALTIASTIFLASPNSIMVLGL